MSDKKKFKNKYNISANILPVTETLYATENFFFIIKAVAKRQIRRYCCICKLNMKLYSSMRQLA